MVGSLIEKKFVTVYVERHIHTNKVCEIRAWKKGRREEIKYIYILRGEMNNGMVSYHDSLNTDRGVKEFIQAR